MGKMVLYPLHATQGLSEEANQATIEYIVVLEFFKHSWAENVGLRK